MSDEEPEMRSFKDARSQELDRMKILKRYIKKKNPRTKESKISKQSEPVEEIIKGAPKIKVEPNLLHKVNESLPNETLKEFIRNRKVTKIGSNTGSKAKKIILEKSPTVAKKTVGKILVTYVNDRKFIPPSINQDASNFERRTLFNSTHRRVPLASIIKK